MPDLEKVEIKSRDELRTWLEANHTQKESVWLVTFKKSVPEMYVSTGDVLDEILCFGWIDGRRMKLDERRTMQLISPRKTQHWSKTYKDRVSKLTRLGRMHDAGLRSVEIAKENGMWDFLNDVDALIVPDDLDEALRKLPPASENFAAFPDSVKRDILRWIKMARKPETRSRRIAESAELAARNERASGTR